MTYKCIIVDDEALARGLIKNHLSQLDNFELIACCGSAIEAITILKQHHIDLMFLDIEMPLLKGTDFLKNLIKRPKVVFTTAYREFALDGFELNAIDYLMKPITFSRFFKAIEKFLESQNTASPQPEKVAKSLTNYIFIRKERKQIKILLDEILYIESIKDYIKIVTHNHAHYTKKSITAFHDELDDRFIRIHRSYIVNSHKVTAYTNNDIEIGKIEIPIGRQFRQTVEAHFKF